jgi:hypothetical protein
MKGELTYTSRLTIVTCWCGMTHGVPQELRDYQVREHRDGRDFSVYCPLGHAYHPSGKAQYLIERERAEVLDARLTATEDQLAAANLDRKRLAKRARNGVCPCCHRSFANVKRHMDSQHPGLH